MFIISFVCSRKLCVTTSTEDTAQNPSLRRCLLYLCLFELSCVIGGSSTRTSSSETPGSAWEISRAWILTFVCVFDYCYEYYVCCLLVASGIP